MPTAAFWTSLLIALGALPLARALAHAFFSVTVAVSRAILDRASAVLTRGSFKAVEAFANAALETLSIVVALLVAHSLAAVHIAVSNLTRAFACFAVANTLAAARRHQSGTGGVL